MASEDFAALVERLAPRLQPAPVVTPEAYCAIECNRCGLCCEDIPVPRAPEGVAAMAEDPSLSADQRRFLAGLEPMEPTAAGWRYRCRHFRRDAGGLGVCGIFETRPKVCRRFPYGGVVRRWAACAWYVQIRAPDGTVLPALPDADLSWAVPVPADGRPQGAPSTDGEMEEHR